MLALTRAWRQCIYASRAISLEFYTMVFLFVFGIYGLIVGSTIDEIVIQSNWIEYFIIAVKIGLVLGPAIALFGIARRSLFTSMCGMALISVTALAHGAVIFVVLFPYGGGFTVGVFFGIGVGYLRVVTNLGRLAEGFSPQKEEKDEGEP